VLLPSPQADRANAVRQWLAAAEAQPSMLKAPWFLMLESDYVWIKPLQVRAWEPGDMWVKLLEANVAGL
jgi:hypothetical protein